jgi:hypothetical protein
LQRTLELLFGSARHYLHGLEPHWPGPIGLSGGDRRRWTHEVRVPDQLAVRTGHLQAVFLPRSHTADPPIARLIRWCELEGLDYEDFDTCREDEFETLCRRCVDYIVRKIL